MTIQEEISEYWTTHIMGSQFLGSDEARSGTIAFFEKLHPIMFRHEYIIPLIEVEAGKLAERRVLEIGCGMGFDSMEFAKREVRMTSVDLAEGAVKIAKEHARLLGRDLRSCAASALSLPFPNDHFDAVYSRGVLHITGDTKAAIKEIIRVVKPGGRIIILNLYHRFSWFNLLHKLGRENIEFQEQDAPLIDLYSTREIKQLFSDFASLEIKIEHFYPYKTLRKGIKASLFNRIFVPIYRLLPKFVVRPFGFKFVITGFKPLELQSSEQFLS